MLPGVSLSASEGEVTDSDVMTASSPWPFTPGFSDTVARLVIVKVGGESETPRSTPSGVELEVREMNPDSTVTVIGADNGLTGVVWSAAGASSVTTNDATRDAASRRRSLSARGCCEGEFRKIPLARCDAVGMHQTVGAQPVDRMSSVPILLQH